MSTLPSQTQLMLPLLQAIDEAGGSARPRDLYDRIAEKVSLAPEMRTASGPVGKQDVNLFERRVRWTRQTAVLKGLIEKGDRAQWTITDKAGRNLQKIRTGYVFTIFQTEQGFFLWGNAQGALTVVEKSSVDLIMTSPPYPLNKQREYGGPDQSRWVEWMLRQCEGWLPLLTDTGSMMLNLGPCWKQGLPAQSLYMERLLVALEDRLGVHLLQRLDWHSPTKLPTPLKWVGIERKRITPSVEPIFWLSPNPNAKGNNRNVLRPYSAGGVRAIREGARCATRPSGISFGANSFVDRGGSIPPSLITAAPTGREDSRYRRAERAAGRKPHPAVMPVAVARFGILLATDEGDTVADFMAGSGTVPVTALSLNRYAISMERSRDYLESQAIRCKAEGINVLRNEVAA